MEKPPTDLTERRGQGSKVYSEEISRTLLLALLLLLLLFLAGHLLTLKGMEEIRDRIKRIEADYRDGGLIFSQLSQWALELEGMAQEALAQEEGPGTRRMIRKFQEIKMRLDSYIGPRLLAASDPGERALWAELQRGIADYETGLVKIVQAAKAGENRPFSPSLEATILATQRKLQVLSRRLFLLHQQAALKRDREISSALGQYRGPLALLAILTFLLGFGIAALALRDIRRKAHRIRRERDFSQTLIQALADGVVLFDGGGKIEFANRRFIEMSGYPPQEVLGKGRSEIFDPEDLAAVLRESESSSSSKRFSAYECRLTRANGRSFPVMVTEAPRFDEKGDRLGSVAVFRDMTEKKEAERRCLELARALEETGECVVITDLEERITYVNQAVSRTYGYDLQELIGRPISFLRTEEDHLFLGPNIRAASLSQGWQGELMNRRKDGSSFPIFLTTSLLRDERGMPYGIVGISRDITERKRAEEEVLQRSRDLAALNAITAGLNQSLDLRETLEATLDRIMEAMSLDGCEIYLREEEEDRWTQVANRGMERDYSQQRTLPHIQPVWQKPMAFAGKPIIVHDLEAEGVHLSLLLQGFLCFASLPILSKGTTIGILNAAGKKAEGFSLLEVALLISTGNQMGMFIENVRSFERERRRVEELSTLIQVAQAVNSSLDLEEVLQAIVSKASQVMNAPVANLMLLDEVTGELHWSANVGLPPEWLNIGNLKVGQSISGLVVAQKAPLAIFEMSQDKRFLYPEIALQYGFHSFLGVPLLLREKAIGGLYICTTEEHRFSEREIRLLSALANQAALAIENARLFAETEKLAAQNFRRYQEVSILNEVGAAMRSTIELDRLLPIILTAVTYGGGLGFNRAILFLVDAGGSLLEGALGMGPGSMEEASHIWSQLAQRSPSLLELCQEISPEALAQSPFNLFVTSLVVPLTPEAGVIARTALERRSFRIEGDGSAEGAINPQYEGRFGSSAFATVPLLVKDRVIGVILVDNFYNGRRITDDDLRFLAALANQAGMAIEAARLYSSLEEAHLQLLKSHHQIVQMERLATLGEMSATVAHQIRNPLVSIGGFARRLSQMNTPDGPTRQYLDIIHREVRRLEEIVKGILSVAKEIRPQFVPADLNKIVRESLTLFHDRVREQRVKLDTDLQPGLPPIPLNPTQLQQVLSNLIENAIEAMPQGGGLRVTTRLAPEQAEVEITDTGPGISPEHLGAIFDPFFTTKEEGTGLGLTMAHRIIAQHGGKIQVTNRAEGGTVFTVSLPLNAEREREASGTYNGA